MSDRNDKLTYRYGWRDQRGDSRGMGVEECLLPFFDGLLLVQVDTCLTVVNIASIWHNINIG